ncbi:MAG: hypothetical protein ACQKBY_01230, partial [Verrucomicrobiales bacterium]
FGDGQGLAPRLRLRDALGRTWQPSASHITWKGWKYVEIPLHQHTAHWGGDESQKNAPLAFPLRLENPFLLDNPLKNPVQGQVRFTLPQVIFD